MTGSTATLEALELVIDRSEGGGRVSRDLMKRRLRKAASKGLLRNWVDDPDWQFRLCSANLMLGRFDWNGWEHRDPWARMLWTNPEALGKPMWKGEGKVLILGEQGLGDEVMFASCIRDIKGEFGITCSSRLRSIFERAFDCPVFDRHEGKELSRARELLKDYDCYIGMGDLPRVLRRSPADFPGKPFLTPDPERVKEMEPYRGKTGISWRGRNGSYPLKDFPQGLSLQYDLAWDEEPEVPHIDLRDDLEGLLALISVLDKVVCVSTTVAHLAGALGKTVEVIQAPIRSARSQNQLNWRWGQKRKSNWYSSATVYQSLNEWRSANRIR